MTSNATNFDTPSEKLNKFANELKAKIKDKLEKLPDDLKAKVKEKLKDALKDQAKDQAKERAADIIVKVLGDTIGGPFSESSPDRLLARQIILDTLNVNAPGAIYDILLNPEFESSTASPAEDTPGYHPGQTPIAVAPPVSPTDPLHDPKTDPPSQPFPQVPVSSSVPVITPTRISGGQNAPAKSGSERDPLAHVDHDTTQVQKPEAPSAEKPIPSHPTIIVEAGQPMAQAHEPRVNMNPEMAGGTAEPTATSKPEPVKASEPALSPSPAPAPSPAARPAPAPSPAPRSYPARESSGGGEHGTYAGPDHGSAGNIAESEPEPTSPAKPSGPEPQST